MFKGISFYACGNPNFPHEKACKCFNPDNPKPALVTMLSFGDLIHVPKYFCNLYSDRKHVWEIHFGFRDFTTNELLEMKLKTKKEIKNRCEKVHLMLHFCINTNTKVLLCPICEDTVTLKAWRKYAKIIRQELPEYKSRLVRSTLKTKEGGNYEERHGTNSLAPPWGKPKSKRIANLDGYPVEINKKQDYNPHCSPEYAEKWLTYPTAFVKFVWEADPQGLRSSYPGGPKPPFNKRKYIISKKAIKWYYNNVK